MPQISLLLALTLLQAESAGLAPVHGIAQALDGDSLKVGKTRVQLFGIDAPEFDQLCTREDKRWACGVAAADQLAELVTGHTVSCLPTGRDQYHRVLARCRSAGTDVNLTMVQTGYAADIGGKPACVRLPSSRFLMKLHLVISGATSALRPKAAAPNPPPAVRKRTFVLGESRDGPVQASPRASTKS